jgi:hypothetical protein
MPEPQPEIEQDKEARPEPPINDADAALGPARGIALGILLAALFWGALILLYRFLT